MAASEKAWTIGCCVSLVAHAVIAWFGLHAYIRDADVALRYMKPHWQSASAQAWVEAEPRAEDLAKKEPEPAVEPALPEPEELVRLTRFGEADGKGTSATPSPGEILARAIQGEQDQAWMSRDPVGPGRLPEEPSPSTAQRGNGGVGGRSGAPGNGGSGGMFGVPPKPAVAPKVVRRPAIVEEMQRLAAAAPRPDPTENLIAIADGTNAPTTRPATDAVVKSEAEKPTKGEDEKRVEGVAMAQASAAPSAPLVKPVATASPAQEVAPAAAATPGAGGNAGDGGGGIAGARAQEADPAPQGDLESDAFSSKGDVTVTAGKIDARLGRAVKPVKPRLQIKAELDIFSIARPSITLLVRIDATGKVTRVKVVKSSGSNDIDLPTVVAMYKWWIEPAKDKNGKAAEDSMQITIAFR